MKKIMSLFGVFLLVIVLGCQSKTGYKTTDLSFFNLKGKVKTFGEIKVIFDVDDKNTFAAMEGHQINYHLFNFDEAGWLEKIDNINPSPYALFGFKIRIDRTEDTLTVKQTSPNEILTRTYSKNKDTLNFEMYNKVDDNSFDYHSEKYKRFISVKDGEFYVMKGYHEGTKRKDVYQKLEYAVTKNKQGNDSLVYLMEPDKSKTLIYKVNYQYDKKNNWTKRQFIKQDKTSMMGINSYSEYRKITYYP